MGHNKGLGETSVGSVLYLLGVWTGFVSQVAKYVIR